MPLSKQTENLAMVCEHNLFVPHTRFDIYKNKGVGKRGIQIITKDAPFKANPKENNFVFPLTLLCGSNTEYTKGLFGSSAHVLYVHVDASATAGDSAESPESTVDLHIIIQGVYERGVHLIAQYAPFKAGVAELGQTR